MRETFELTSANVENHVRKDSAGNYHLGRSLRENGRVRVGYVGRADNCDHDLYSRLQEHVREKDGKEKDRHYRYFEFSYAANEIAAYEQECMDFHDYGGTEKLDNDMHPDRPDGYGDSKTLKCPVCGNPLE